jgi:hypothetical protein
MVPRKDNELDPKSKSLSLFKVESLSAYYKVLCMTFSRRSIFLTFYITLLRKKMKKGPFLYLQLSLQNE